MSILTGLEIQKQVEAGRINIHPFNLEQLSYNSYDLCLGEKLLVSKKLNLNILKTPEYHEIIIPGDGLEIQPGRLYLGSTIETAGSNFYVPDIAGKSRMGRYGLSVHSTAGWGGHRLRSYGRLDARNQLYPTGEDLRRDENLPDTIHHRRGGNYTLQRKLQGATGTNGTEVQGRVTNAKWTIHDNGSGSDAAPRPRDYFQTGGQGGAEMHSATVDGENQLSGAAV